MAAVDEDDVFWKIQLSGHVDALSAIKPRFTSEVQWSDHQDCALPAGTELTDAALARVLGDVQVVSIPMMANRFDASRSVGQREPMLLSVRLRQVNGEGVMSGVGGDVWSAALLLSAWLLTNPEVVRDQAILELGSGLGLCGIVAGYLSESVTLTDYVDELLVNLHHNIELNRKPRIVSGQDSLLSPERETTKDGVFCCDYPPRRRLGVRETGGDETSAAVDQASPGLCVSPHPSLSKHDTAEPERCGHPKLKSSETCENLSSTSASTVRGCVPLQPLQRMSVRKVDWNNYTARHPAGDNARQNEGRSKFWWDDEGPTAGGSGTTAASGAVGLEPLRCDVVIGSALIYSPHHACVADVLWHAFTGGGCRVAYIVQLSTRPGFDEFLQRLGSLGLRYRLKKISAALPFPLCNELRRRASVDVVGGPVTCSSSSNACHDKQVRTSPEEGREFDEFVLCKVFRASKT